MRVAKSAFTVLICAPAMLIATMADASPLAPGTAFPTAGATVQAIHHKPGHRGGPPWMRDRDDRRSNERRVDRDDGRSRPARVCQTQYRTEYDPYDDEYVRRPVQVCRNVY